MVFITSTRRHFVLLFFFFLFASLFFPCLSDPEHLEYSSNRKEIYPVEKFIRIHTLSCCVFAISVWPQQLNIRCPSFASISIYRYAGCRFVGSNEWPKIRWFIFLERISVHIRRPSTFYLLAPHVCYVYSLLHPNLLVSCTYYHFIPFC